MADKTQQANQGDMNNPNRSTQQGQDPKRVNNPSTIETPQRKDSESDSDLDIGAKGANVNKSSTTR